MTDIEINEAVARKLGWTDIHKVQTGQTVGNPPNQLVSFADELPAYCHSIEAAWEIVEHLDKRQMNIILENEPHEKGHLWLFSFNWAVSENEDWEVAEYAPTAPMAICLAFLNMPELK